MSPVGRTKKLLSELLYVADRERDETLLKCRNPGCMTGAELVVI